MSCNGWRGVPGLGQPRDYLHMGMVPVFGERTGVLEQCKFRQDIYIHTAKVAVAVERHKTESFYKATTARSSDRKAKTPFDARKM